MPPYFNPDKENPDYCQLFQNSRLKRHMFIADSHGVSHLNIQNNCKNIAS